MKFFSMLLQFPIHRKSTTVTEKKYHRIATQQAKSDTIQKGMLFSPNSDYTYFSYDLTIRSSKSLEYSLKLFPDANFKTETLDMGRFRTYVNPTVGAIHSAHPVRGALRIRPGVFNSSVPIGNPERHARKASHRGSKQQ